MRLLIAFIFLGSLIPHIAISNTHLTEIDADIICDKARVWGPDVADYVEEEVRRGLQQYCSDRANKKYEIKYQKVKYPVSDYLLTEQCEKTISEEGFSTFEIWNDAPPDYLPVVNRDNAVYSIRDIHFSMGFNGYLFQTRGQEIVHCSPYTHTPDFILVERDTGYSLFATEKFELTRFTVHHMVSCGTACIYSTVETIEFPDKTSFEPNGITEIKSRLYDYPNKWFLSYLNEEERKLLEAVNE